MTPPFDNASTISQHQDHLDDLRAIGIENLRSMLLELSETKAHEIEHHTDECKKLIRTYFTDTL